MAYRKKKNKIAEQFVFSLKNDKENPASLLLTDNDGERFLYLEPDEKLDDFWPNTYPITTVFDSNIKSLDKTRETYAKFKKLSEYENAVPKCFNQLEEKMGEKEYYPDYLNKCCNILNKRKVSFYDAAVRAFRMSLESHAEDGYYPLCEMEGFVGLMGNSDAEVLDIYKEIIDEENDKLTEVIISSLRFFEGRKSKTAALELVNSLKVNKHKQSIENDCWKECEIEKCF